MSFDIFVVTYRVPNVLPKLADILLFFSEKTEFSFFEILVSRCCLHCLQRKPLSALIACADMRACSYILSSVRVRRVLRVSVHDADPAGQLVLRHGRHRSVRDG